MLKNIVVENITLPAKMNCLLLKGQKSKFFQFHRDATKYTSVVLSLLVLDTFLIVI